MARLIPCRVATIFVVGCLFQRDDHNIASALIVSPRRIGIGRKMFGTIGNNVIHNRLVSELYSAPSDDDTDEPDESKLTDADLDKQILALENMMKSGTNDNDDASKLSSNTSILTSARKQRLEREIELIRQLDPEHPDNNPDYSDLQNQELVVSQLWALWYGERGALNEQKLRAIEELLNDPEKWHQAENMYLELIREHCSIDGSLDNLSLSNWVEPANRLATQLYFMGRLAESKKWCERIIRVKPWHIGALSGILMVCMKMGDKAGVMKYSVMGLPNLSDQMRNLRKDWVGQNVHFAQRSLTKLEESNRKAYGEPDKIGVSSSNEMPVQETDSIESSVESSVDDETSAWQ